MNEREKREKEVEDLFNRKIVNATLNNDKFILFIKQEIEDSKELWQVFGNLITRDLEEKNIKKEGIEKRLKELDQEIIQKLLQFFKPIVKTPSEHIFVLEKFRFTSLMSLLTIIQKIEDEKLSEK
jgi:hypothetical protein